MIAHKDRRTSKVRQAAKHSHIKIVTTQWLFDCFARWEKVDEAAYTLDVERGGHSSRDALPFEDLPDVLSSSASDDEGEDMGIGLDDEDFAPPPPPLEENDSPIEMSDNQWSMINDELDEFLKSDGDEDEGFQSDVSMNSAQSNGAIPGTPSRRKRKRPTDSADASDAEVEADGETESDASVNGIAGSKLEHRKKRARNRTSALNNATSARSDKSSGLPSPDTTGPEEGHGEKVAAVDEDEEEIDDRALEQALMDEFEREENEADSAAS